MRFPRLHVRWLAGCLILTLLFMHLVTAAYACPASGAAAPVTMAEMPGCDGSHMAAASVDPAQPQLCKAHCQQGSQTASPAVAADLPWVPMLLAVLDWTPAMRLPKQALMPAFGITAGAAPPGAIPLYLSLQVLRN